MHLLGTVHSSLVKSMFLIASVQGEQAQFVCVCVMVAATVHSTTRTGFYLLGTTRRGGAAC